MKHLTSVVVMPMVLALASANCGSTGSEETAQPEANSQATPDSSQTSPPSMIVHATVSLGKDHEVRFVEYRPGMVGTIEEGRSMVDVPVLTSEVTKLTWEDQYRHFAGASAHLPKAMVGALARVAATPISTISAPPAAADTQNVGAGPHFYNAGEQAWFNATFCNRASICIQGFDFTNMQTPFKVSHASTVATIGVEGTSNGTFQNFYWACANPPWPFPQFCAWFENGTAVIVPGHFINTSVSGNGSWFFKWELRGGGANTTVSSSANF